MTEETGIKYYLDENALKKGRCPVGRLPLRGLFTQP